MPVFRFTRAGVAERRARGARERAAVQIECAGVGDRAHAQRPGLQRRRAGIASAGRRSPTRPRPRRCRRSPCERADLVVAAGEPKRGARAHVVAAAADSAVSAIEVSGPRCSGCTVPELPNAVPAVRVNVPPLRSSVPVLVMVHSSEPDCRCRPRVATPGVTAAPAVQSAVGQVATCSVPAVRLHRSGVVERAGAVSPCRPTGAVACRMRSSRCPAARASRR